MFWPTEFESVRPRDPCLSVRSTQDTPTERHPNDEFDPRVDVEEEHQIDVYEYAQRGRERHERHLQKET